MVRESALPKKDNAAGLSGFIISLVGVFLCGIPSIIGVVVSAIGLRKEPRGLAIAGLALGLVGLVEFAGAGFMAYRTIQTVNQTFGKLRDVVGTELLNDAAVEVGHQWERLERIPTQEEGQEVVSGKRDFTGNSIVYETDGVSFSLRSAGADGMLETEDDLVVGPFSDLKTVKELEAEMPDFDSIEDGFEEFENEMNF